MVVKIRGICCSVLGFFVYSGSLLAYTVSLVTSWKKTSKWTCKTRLLVPRQGWLLYQNYGSFNSTPPPHSFVYTTLAEVFAQVIYLKMHIFDTDSHHILNKTTNLITPRISNLDFRDPTPLTFKLFDGCKYIQEALQCRNYIGWVFLSKTKVGRGQADYPTYLVQLQPHPYPT